MDILFEEHFFRDGRTPQWLCSKCNNGMLFFVSGSLKTMESAKTQYYQQKYRMAFDCEMHFGVFNAFLKCISCHEHYAVSGRYDYHTITEDDPMSGPYEVDDKFFYPEHFSPYIRIFKTPQKCPASVVKEIERVFSLYWIDLEACANKIRVVIEVVLTDQGIAPTGNLGERINNYHADSEEIKDCFNAIRWVGNIGSHASGNLKRERVFDALKILELILNKLYDRTEKEIINIAKTINANKGK